MKEIIIRATSYSPKILGGSIKLEEVSHYCYGMLLIIIKDSWGEWFDIMTIGGNGLLTGFEQRNSAYDFTNVYSGRTTRDVLNSIKNMYPLSEFYLVESWQDLFQIIKDRMPGWLLQ
jgi:hypothetical protein